MCDEARPRSEARPPASTCSCHATGTLYCASFSSAKRASLFALSVFACLGNMWGEKWE